MDIVIWYSVNIYYHNNNAFKIIEIRNIKKELHLDSDFSIIFKLAYLRLAFLNAVLLFFLMKLLPEPLSYPSTLQYLM